MWICIEVCIEGLGVGLNDDTPLVFLKPDAVVASADEAQQGVLMEDSTVAQTETHAETPATSTEEPPLRRLKVGDVAMAHVDEIGGSSSRY